MKTDFFITYHHGDELAARWIAGVLKDVPFSLFMESWDFLPGQKPIEKIEYMTAIAPCALVLLSDRFLQAGVEAESWQAVTETFNTNAVVLLRIDSCNIDTALGAVPYTDLFGIKEAEARKRLLAAVGTPTPDKKETEGLRVTATSRDEVLEKRKAELEELLTTTIKHNYHMKLDLEQEVEKEVEVEGEKTGKKEKRKQWVWEAVALETVLKDGNNYILVNPSGMGKTTFLTHTARVLLDGASDGDYPFLPLFFTCIALNNREGSITNFINSRVEWFYNNSRTAVVHGELENLCVLLDALDQARDVDDIVSSLQVHDKYDYYKKAKIILSSRENTAGKVKTGFRNIRLKLPEADEVWHYLGEENYKQMEGHIAASGELVKVPVLLEMLKTITERGYDASKLWSRADLYTEFTRILVDQERNKPRFWQDDLAIRNFLDNELEQALEKIAFFSLVENRILEIEKEELVKYCETLEKKEALLSIGIILELFEDREQKIVFRHQSFQAYFAARYMYFRRPELFEKLTDDIAFFYNDVWYEVIRFFVGLEKDPQKAGDIIDLLFDYNSSGINLGVALRLIFTVFLMSEARVNVKKVQNLHEQLMFLLTETREYLHIFFSNIDKFNPSNNNQRRSLFIIIETIIRDKGWVERLQAGKALGKICIANDIPLLKSMIRDENWVVRNFAAEALGNIVTANDIPLLEVLLRDEDKNVRRIAAEALGKIGTANDIPLLEHMINDRDISCLRTVAEALGKIGTANEIPLLETMIKDKDDLVCRDAVVALGKIGAANDIPLLIPLLRDREYRVRSAAAEALGKIGTAKDIPLLEPLLREWIIEIRIIAAEALRNIVSVNDTPLLEPLLRDRYIGVRCAAAKALGKIGTANDTPLLKPLLRDENQFVRSAAAEALGNIGAAKDIPLLEPLLRDKELRVRSAATEALGNIATAKGIPLLEPLLRARDTDVRRAAAKALGKIGTANDTPLLKPLLRDEDQFVRIAGAEALGNIVTVNDIPLLIPLLRDRDYRFRCAATESLREIGTANDISLLEPLLRDKESPVQIAAAEAIEQIYKRSTPELHIDDVFPKSKKKEMLFLKTAPTQSLHILHISDIHYVSENDLFITRIFHEFLKDIKKWRNERLGENIHAMCLTGDIAQSGQKDQYQSINEKINKILETTGCSKDNLFIIPGNHDVHEYNTISPQGKTTLEQVRENKITIDSHVLPNFEIYREFHEKFNHYYTFLQTSGYLNSLTETHNGNPKPWYSRKLKDFPVRIIGLNSALFCLKDYCQRNKIRMGSRQFDDAYFQGKLKDTDNNEAVILLTHHPMDWLEETEYNDYTTLMEQYAFIHLHGHIHRLKIRKLSSFSGSSYLSIGTGSLYGEKGTKDINTYHIMTLDFKNEEIHIWGRRWVPEHSMWTTFMDNSRDTFSFPKME